MAENPVGDDWMVIAYVSADPGGFGSDDPMLNPSHVRMDVDISRRSQGSCDW